MFDRRRLLQTLAATVATSVAVRAHAGTASNRLNAPGPEARLLDTRTGFWDVTETVWPGEGGAPVVSTGLVAERRMLGTLLQEIIRAPGDRTDKAVKRTDLLHYNRLEGQWDYVSFDTRAPVGLMPANSIGPGDGQTIELIFAPFAVPGGGDAPTGQLLRMRQLIRFDDPDRDTKDQYFSAADGSGRSWLAHRYAYRRRA